MNLTFAQRIFLELVDARGCMFRGAQCACASEVRQGKAAAERVRGGRAVTAASGAVFRT